jgi:glycosyltransferase
MIVTIITTVKNGEETILDTINSVNSQSYRYIQHIIIDSNSTDDTMKLVKKNVKLFSTVVSEPDNGIYDGINKGILKSSGDIIGILNADDFYVDNKVIEKVVYEFSRRNINFLYADLEYVDNSNYNKIFRRWRSGDFNLAKLKFGWMPPHPTIFFRKSLISKLGLFNIEYKISSDYDFILRYLLSPQINVGYLQETIIKMRIGGVSNRSIENIFKKSLEDYRIIKKHNLRNFSTLFFKNLRKLPQLFLYKK